MARAAPKGKQANPAFHRCGAPQDYQGCPLRIGSANYTASTSWRNCPCAKSRGICESAAARLSSIWKHRLRKPLARSRRQTRSAQAAHRRVAPTGSGRQRGAFVSIGRMCQTDVSPSIAPPSSTLSSNRRVPPFCDSSKCWPRNPEIGMLPEKRCNIESSRVSPWVCIASIDRWDIGCRENQSCS